jgi:hypothetical protein
MMVLKEEPVEADQIQKVMASESALLPAVAAGPLTPSSWTGVWDCDVNGIHSIQCASLIAVISLIRVFSTYRYMRQSITQLMVVRRSLLNLKIGLEIIEKNIYI